MRLISSAVDSRFIHQPLRASVHALGLLVVLLFAASCAKSTTTPTTPTPTPIAPPSITCPASLSLTSAQATPISVEYGVPTVSGGASPITTTCSPDNRAVFSIGATTVTCTATDAQQRTSSCSLTVTLKAPPTVRLTKFVAFGDSLTKGEDGNNTTLSPTGVLTFLQPIIRTDWAYPTVLTNSMRARYSLQSSAINVVNQGCPGEMVNDNSVVTCNQPVVTRFSSVIQGQQVVLLMEGSNDVNFGPKDALILNDTIFNLQRMVRAAKSSGVTPYIATLPPMTGSGRGIGASLVPGFNDRIRSLAASEGITLVDVYAAFNGDMSLIGADGLHLNQGGYQRVADAFLQSIQATLEQAPALASSTFITPTQQ